MTQKEYCRTCNNRSSPLCELCQVIESPKSGTGVPSMFMRYRALPGKKNAEAFAAVLDKYLTEGYPLPMTIVLRYNDEAAKRLEDLEL